MFWYKLFVYGGLGLLVECIFTGLWSLVHKNWRLTSTTYLWMWPIYGLGAVQLEYIYNWHPLLTSEPATLTGLLLLKAIMMVVVIFANEFMWGVLLHKLTGKKIWDYGAGKHTLMGYIRWDYAGFWFVLAIIFELIADKLQRIFNVINAVL